MKKSLFVLAAAASIAAGAHMAAQNPPAAAPAQGRAGGAPPQQMGFFVTSTGIGNGANLGGLAGADAYCQKLATDSGRDGAAAKTWHAYLSTQGPNAVNARDRIGSGPWANSRGAVIAPNLAALHGDTLDQARLGNNLSRSTVLTEKQTTVNGVGDTPNQHDMLTGSQPDGRAYTDAADHTCGNWTSAADGMGTAQLGHFDRTGGGNTSWNSAHASRGCSLPNLIATGGNGYFYCFAVN
jgi:hypothetical protein